MNPVLADPDVKVNMSLDEIIQLTKGDIKNEMQRRNVRNMKKKKLGKRMNNMAGREPVQLVSSAQASSIYLTKKGLLNVEGKRRVAQFVSNREVNSELLRKSKEIIPAEYRLVKTAYGVERILVPAAEYIIDSKKKLLIPRKQSAEFPPPSQSPCPELSSESPDMPPLLIAAPIYKTPESTLQSHETVLTPELEDEIVVLDCPNSKKNQQEVIDVESNLPVDIVEIKKLFMPGISVMPPNKLKTLNDRFTLLTGNFQF